MPLSGRGRDAFELNLKPKNLDVELAAARLELLQALDVEQRRVQHDAVELAALDQAEQIDERPDDRVAANADMPVQRIIVDEADDLERRRAERFANRREA